MFETILVISYFVISFFSLGFFFHVPWLIAAVAMLVYTILYTYIGSFFVSVDGSTFELGIRVYFWFAVFLVVMGLAIFFGSGKRTKSGKLDKRYSKQNAEAVAKGASTACSLFLTGVSCLLVCFGLMKLITYFGWSLY